MSTHGRSHNKRGNVTVTVANIDDSRASFIYDELLAKATRDVQGLCPGSTCIMTSAKDGRYSRHSKKEAYGYQVVARVKYTQDVLAAVTASKKQTDNLISHLCGKGTCINHEHIIIETKAINDERTHCHFVMEAGRRMNGSVEILWQCPHQPKCGEVDKTQLASYVSREQRDAAQWNPSPEKRKRSDKGKQRKKKKARKSVSSKASSSKAPAESESDDDFA